MDTHVQTDATSIFGKTIETLNNLNGRPPEWYEVIAMLKDRKRVLCFYYFRI